MKWFRRGDRGVPVEQIQAPQRARVWRMYARGNSHWLACYPIAGGDETRVFPTHARAIAHADKEARR